MQTSLCRHHKHRRQAKAGGWESKVKETQVPSPEDSQNRNHTGVGKPLDHGGLLLQLKLSRCATIISVTGVFDTAPFFGGYDQKTCKKTAPSSNSPKGPTFRR